MSTQSYPMFFPGPAFGWAFVALLAAALLPASYIDARRLVVPKWLTLPMLAAGLAFNLARGSRLGARGVEAWHLGAHGPGVGAVDGLLFAAAGMLVGFLLFFGLWAMGTCGGGDVKLFAALGAWVGPFLAVCVLMGTIVLVAGIVAAKLAWRLAARAASGAGRAGGPRDRVVSFSLPVSIATAAVVLWSFGHELATSPSPEAPAPTSSFDPR